MFNRIRQQLNRRIKRGTIEFLAMIFLSLITIGIIRESWISFDKINYIDKAAKEIAFQEFNINLLMNLSMGLAQIIVIYVILRIIFGLPDENQVLTQEERQQPPNTQEVIALNQQNISKKEITELKQNLDEALVFLLKSGELGYSQLRALRDFGVITSQQLNEYDTDILKINTNNPTDN